MDMNDELISKVRGCLLGLAVGDAMGMPSSFLFPEEIKQLYGQIEDFNAPQPDHIYHAGLRRGEITDDTEQSIAMANSFIRNGCINPHDIVDELLAWALRVEHKYASPFGPSTQQALNAIKNGSSLVDAGKQGDTNGAAMRIAPLGIIHGVRGSTLDETVRDVALACFPTHGTQVAIGSAAAVAWSVASCIQGEKDLYHILKESEKAAKAGVRYGNRVIAPSIQRRLAWTADQVYKSNNAESTILALYEFFGGGVAAADSIPIALGVFAICRGNPQRIILTSVNMGSDSDTIGAIAGALGGAYAGEKAIPIHWVEAVQDINQLEVKTLANALIEVASRWKPASEEQLFAWFEGKGGDV
jgi:ADP-ribosylglycohydrolase